MPPKPKFTREEVAATALAIIKGSGVSALTAREVGKRLGTTASPIFTIFTNMEDLKRAARALALKEFEEYVGDYREYTPAFKRVGMKMVSYAIYEPELYKLLFMQEYPSGQSFSDTMKELGEMVDICIALMQRDYNLNEPEAKVLFEQTWIYTFGIGSLCAMKVCDFTEEEISNRLGQVFMGQLTMIKSGQMNYITGVPQKETEKQNEKTEKENEIE
ncbi:MAG: TetR/AcrR family transcriptional regulator [Butyribacter sp.]|nr:TetR/AcrR family transcriptional regulator [bacterium]MDY3854349.1 TetR/AcrR family transcriptional regulator [Butyribacter sp.]